MAYGYWKLGMQDHQAVFNLFFRNAPFKGQYAVCAGLETVIDYLKNFKFSDEDLKYLAELNFDKKFLSYLKNLKFNCDIAAIEEGEIVFAKQPLLKISGPLLQCQLLETPLLNIINFQTLIATKAARVCQAAAGDAVVEFGLRRAQGFDGGLSASRAAYIGGCDATSNTLAGKVFNIPVRGTHAHSWVMAFPTELDSFAAYAKVLPDNCILLVDTYDSVQGIKNAIEIGKQLKQQGKNLLGVRLDSGDLVKLSHIGRKLLDQAGFKKAIIFASGDLDEYEIKKLKTKGAKIDVWGVGTRLVTAFDQPALDGVYKLAAIRESSNKPWQYKFKRSENLSKISAPGLLQVRRYFKKTIPVTDLIFDEQLGISQAIEKKSENLVYTDLIKPVFKSGKLIYKLPLLTKIRQKTLKNLQLFNKTKKYLVTVEAKLNYVRKSINHNRSTK